MLDLSVIDQEQSSQCLVYHGGMSEVSFWDLSCFNGNLFHGILKHCNYLIFKGSRRVFHRHFDYCDIV